MHFSLLVIHMYMAVQALQTEQTALDLHSLSWQTSESAFHVQLHLSQAAVLQ